MKPNLRQDLVASGALLAGTVLAVGCVLGGCEGGYAAAGAICLRLWRTCTAAMAGVEHGLEAVGGANGKPTNAGTRSIDDLLRPGGLTIGKAGTDDTIREITGGLSEAEAMFQQLSHGGTIVSQTPKLTRVELPNGGGSVQLRTVMSRSPNTAATIDVNIPGIDIRKLKFNP